MAFVNELVPEEQKTKFDITIFYDPTRAIDKRILFYRWVVDHERDLFLIKLGGGGPWSVGDDPRGPKHYFAFSYKGEVVKFEATYHSEGSSKSGTLVGYCEVYNINIPPALEKQRNEVLALLKEALDARGDSTGHREKLSAVNITFK